MSEKYLESKRPLSPHLQVYKLPFNALMSITGRVIGVKLFIALSIALIWLNASIWTPSLFDATINFLNIQYVDIAVRYIALIAAFGIFLYLGNGIRHVLWDFGIGLNVKWGEKTGVLAIIFALIATLILGYLTA